MRAFLLDLGICPYVPAFQIQERAFRLRQEGRLPAVVIVQENLPVFTIGRGGSPANILAGAAELERRGIEVVEVNRGGDVTYHGPGQLIVSPLVYLGDLDLNANQFLHRLEDVILTLLAAFGIQAVKDPEHPGAWVEAPGLRAGNPNGNPPGRPPAAKIGSVGLAVKHGYTQHGFSINVDLDLAPFQLIHPCGVPQMPVTSMSAQLGRKVAVSAVKRRLEPVFRRELRLALEPAPEPLISTLTDTNLQEP